MKYLGIKKALMTAAAVVMTVGVGSFLWAQTFNVTTAGDFYARIADYETADDNVVIEVDTDILIPVPVEIPTPNKAGMELTIKSKNPASPVTLTRGAYGHLFVVPDDAALILENIVIDGGGASFTGAGNSLLRAEGGLIEMKSGTVLRNNVNSDNGGGVSVVFGGTFIMDGGEIIGNVTGEGYGGGVAVGWGGGGTFIMNGGSIGSNTSFGSGGGVLVLDGTFTMNGGSISGNSVTSMHTPGEVVGTGGGVYVDALGKFTMTGGEISENTSLESNGVYVNAIYDGQQWFLGEFLMTGGVAAGNGYSVYDVVSDLNMINSNYGDNGIVIAYDIAAQTTYIAGTRAGLDFQPDYYSDASVVWAREGGKNGIFYSYSGNDGFIEINGVTLKGPGDPEYGFYQQVASYATATEDVVIEVDQNLTLSMFVNIPEPATADITLTIRSKNPAMPNTLMRGTYGDLFTVLDGAALILENIIIDGDRDDVFNIGGGSLVMILGDGTFVMEDGAVLRNNASVSYGGGVYVADGGVFTMNGGEIRGNELSDYYNCEGGGVYVSDDGTFIMTDGEISGNTAAGFGVGRGGGIAVSNGTFTMEGGKISGNVAHSMVGGSGSGVYNGGIFTMMGGEISGNTSKSGNAGSINNNGSDVSNGGTFIITGGVVAGRGSNINGVVSGSYNLNAGDATSPNNGIIIAWDSEAGTTTYDAGTNTDLTTNPNEASGATAQWAFQNSKSGVSYSYTSAGGANEGFIEIAGVTVIPDPNYTIDITWYTNNPTADIFTITTANQLAGLAALVNNTAGLGSSVTFENKTIRLGNDIVLNDTAAAGGWRAWGENTTGLKQWTPIGSSFENRFYGDFDGNGHVVLGLYINTAAQFQGLFGFENWQGSISNLGLAGFYVRGGQGTGGIGGGGRVISNSYVIGNVFGESYVGGISGWGGEVTNSYAIGNVSGTEYVGGINGSSTVINSYFVGSVTGTNNVGAISGNIDAPAINSFYNSDLATAGNLNSNGISKTTAEMQSREFHELLQSYAKILNTVQTDGSYSGWTYNANDYPTLSGTKAVCDDALCDFYAKVAFYETSTTDVVIEVDQNLTLDALVEIPTPNTAGRTLTIRSKTPLAPVVLTRGVSGNLFTVAANATLILESIIIDGDKEGDFEDGGGSLVFVNGGTLVMDNGAVVRNNTFAQSMVILDGTFNMNGGKISGNNGSGVVIVGSIFYMTGGEISNNTGYGVHTANNPAFTMNGGTINSNGSSGVFVTSGTFNMVDGEISGNTANSGNGVFISSGTFTMTGGVVAGTGASVDDVISGSCTLNPNPATDNGLIIVWNKPSVPAPIIYDEGTSTNLIVSPTATASAVWGAEGLEYGISYANGTNTGFIAIADVKVTGDNADITHVRALIESTDFDSAAMTALNTQTLAKLHVEYIIAGLELDGVTVLVADNAFTAAIAGTAGNLSGTNGRYVFTVNLSKGTGTPQTTAACTLVITATPYDVTQDNLDITAAKSIIEGMTLTAVAQSTLNTLELARPHIISLIDALGLDGIEADVVDGEWVAAVAGTATSTSGTDGSYTFTVNLNKGGGTQQTTAERTLAISATSYAAAQDNADIAAVKLLIEAADFGSVAMTVFNTLEAARDSVLAIIDDLELNGVIPTLVDENFSAAVAGTVGNLTGTGGSYTFTVALNKGIGVQQETAVLTMLISTIPYDAAQDNLDITAAKSIIEDVVFGSVTMSTLNTLALAKLHILAIINGLQFEGVIPAVIDGDFTAAIAGTVDNLNGTDGSYAFTVALNKGAGTEQVTSELTLVIRATRFILDAEIPVITAQPTGGTVVEGRDIEISITAEVSDGGVLSYQWYISETGINSDGSLIDGETGSTFDVPTSVPGIYHYYVVVTNTNSSANGEETAAITSDAATVTVNAVVNAVRPRVSSQPSSGAITVGVDHRITVTAGVSDNGTLTYQWYSSTTASNTGGTAIDGATGLSYSFPAADTGTFYYYVVITNTIADNDDGGIKSISAVSSIVTVVVESIPEVISGFAGLKFISPSSANDSLVANRSSIYEVRVMVLDSSGDAFTDRAVAMRLSADLAGVVVAKNIITDRSTGIAEFSFIQASAVVGDVITFTALAGDISETAVLHVTAPPPEVTLSNVIGEFTAGPNPVAKSAGIVNFFHTGTSLTGAQGTLSIYDAQGNLVNRINIDVRLGKSSSISNTSRRNIGSWNLRDTKGRPVAAGTYLARGTITTSNGKREQISIIIGIR
ncbi:MAG: hypothetical protein FWE57_06560 [Chitinispirillia bacterium]|nr:hypothetical protein [Chitinispirillia bacterium]